MTIWQTLGRILPWNRDNKWPTWVQLLVFLGIEALFFLAVQSAQQLIYGNSVYRWANSAFGEMHSDFVLELIAVLCCTEICAWRMGLHRVVPFGGREPRRWTILPVVLWYAGVQLMSVVLMRAFAGWEAPILTDNLLVYPVLNTLLMLLCFTAFAIMVHSMRSGRSGRAWMLLAAQLALVAVMCLLNQGSLQVQNRLLFQGEQQTAPTIMVYGGENAGELPDAFAGLMEDPNAFLSAVTGQDLTGEDAPTILFVEDPADLSAWNAYPADPSALEAFAAGPAAYNEAMAPVNTLSDVLCVLETMVMFFIMKKWLFPAVPAAEMPCIP